MTSSSSIRVLQVFHGLGTGGAETWLMALLRHWNERLTLGLPTVQTDILLTGGEAGTYDAEAKTLGAELFYSASTRANLPQFTSTLRQIYRSRNYDAVHSHSDYLAGFHFAIGLGLLPCVRVAHVHNPKLHMTANYAVSPLRKVSASLGKVLVNQLATHVCGTSAHALLEYGFPVTSSSKPDVSVLHCGFKVEQFSGERTPGRAAVRAAFGWPDTAQVILFAGRLDRAMAFEHPQNHKNSWLALHVARAAAQRDPKVRFIMAGAGDQQRQELEAVVADWGLADRFKLVGVRHDIPHLMRGSDLLLFPSRQEGLGMVAVEAQAAGLPVLASTAVPQECVVLPDLCRFSPLTDPPDQWAVQALELMNQPKLKPEHCAEAVRASAFSIENSAAALETIYRGGAK